MKANESDLLYYQYSKMPQINDKNGTPGMRDSFFRRVYKNLSIGKK